MSTYAYLLRCADDSLYCGWTDHLSRRLAAHNSGRGAKYTRGRGPVQLVYSEKYATKSEAMRREAQLKRLTRAQKQALIDALPVDELLPIYDADDHPCGLYPRALVHAHGLYHYVCHLTVIGQREGVPGLWLQKRAADRALYPGYYDLTATGHLDPNETPAQAALREAYEEVGLRLKEEQLVPVGDFLQCYAHDGDDGWDEERAYAFVCRMDGIPPFAAGSEVGGLFFAPLYALERTMAHGCPIDVLDCAGALVEVAPALLCCGKHEEEWYALREAMVRQLGMPIA